MWTRSRESRRSDAISMIGRLSVEFVNGASLQTPQKIAQHAIPLLPIDAACEMTLVAVDFEVGSIDARRLQFRHYVGCDTWREQLVGARQHVEHLRPDLREILLGVVMRPRLRQRNHRVGVEGPRPRLRELLDHRLALCRIRKSRSQLSLYSVALERRDAQLRHEAEHLGIA